MSDWPQATAISEPRIVSALSVDTEPGRAAVGYTPASFTQTANRVTYVPFYVPVPQTVSGMGWVNGSVISGTVHGGIYSFLGKTLIVSGSVAQAGASVAQTLDLTDTPVEPGWYWMAVGISAAGSFISSTTGSGGASAGAHGVCYQDAAVPLPNPAVPVLATNQVLVPLAWVTLLPVVP